jgi:all-trans-retinol 13,14-reductase
VCLYLGFRGDIRAAGASEANRWMMNDFREEVWDAVSMPPSSYLSFPSLKDGEEHDGLHTGQVVVMTDWKPFERFAGGRWRQRGEEYEQLKAAISDRLLGVVLKRMPALAPMVAHRELSTPASTVHFVRGVHGAAYGLEPNRARFENRWLRPRTPVRGLVQAGCDVSLVGIAGALVGGIAAAVSLEPERAGNWLKAAIRARGGRRP